MAYIAAPRQQTEQPKSLVLLNDKHPLFNDIVFAYSAGRGANDGKQRAGSVVGNVSTSVGLKGKRVIPADASSYLNFPHDSDYDTLGGVTIITVLRTTTSIVSQQGLVTKCETGGGANTPWALLMEASQQPAFNRSNSGFRVWRTSATLSDNTDYVIAVSQGADISVSPRFYINGYYDNSGTASLYGGSGSGAPTGNTTSVKIGNRTDLATQSSTLIYDTVVFKKVLTDAQIVDLSRNIYQVWQARDRLVWIPAGAVSYTLTASSGSFAVTGTSANLKFGRLVSASSGSVAITGTAATLKHGSLASGNSGSFAVTGTAASLLFGRLLSAGSGSFAITGTNATLTKATGGQFTLSADSGAFVVTGNASSLGAGRVLSASSGSAIVTGTSAGLIAKRVSTASPGAFVVTGADATLTLAAHSHYSLVASGGSVDVTGAPANLLYVTLDNREAGGDDAPVRVVYKKRKKTLEEQPNKHLESIFEKVVKEFKGEVEKPVEGTTPKPAPVKTLSVKKPVEGPTPAKADKEQIEAERELLALYQEQVRLVQLQDDEELLMLIAEMI